VLLKKVNYLKEWNLFSAYRYIRCYRENLPAHFINESLSDVYGDNKVRKIKKLKAKNSGFSNNQQILSFVKDLYSDYDIYNNHLAFFF
jgi:hypothetical protein